MSVLPPITVSPALQRHLRCLHVDFHTCGDVHLPKHVLLSLGQLSALTELVLLTSQNPAPGNDNCYSLIAVAPDFGDADLAALLAPFRSRLVHLALNVDFPGTSPGTSLAAIARFYPALETLRCPEIISLEPSPDVAAVVVMTDPAIIIGAAARPAFWLDSDRGTRDNTVTSAALFPRLQYLHAQGGLYIKRHKLLEGVDRTKASTDDLSADDVYLASSTLYEHCINRLTNMRVFFNGCQVDIVLSFPMYPCTWT